MAVHGKGNRALVDYAQYHLSYLRTKVPFVPIGRLEGLPEALEQVFGFGIPFDENKSFFRVAGTRGR